MTDYLYCKYVHSPIQHIIYNTNVFTNLLPYTHAINPNNETCLVTCAVSLTCATWLMFLVCTYLRHVHTYIVYGIGIGIGGAVG